jgi:hypothetical protein
MSTVIVKTKVNTTVSKENTEDIRPAFLRGSWYQIARWEFHDDIFRNSTLVEWVFLPKSESYFSTKLVIKYVERDAVYEGYSTLSPNGVIKIVLSIGDDVVSLGEYLLRYTDYSSYTFLSAPGDLLILSRKPDIRPYEIPTILAKSESFGYSGSKVFVNEAALNSMNNLGEIDPRRTAEIRVAPAPPFTNNAIIRENRIGKKVSLDDDITPQETVSTSFQYIKPYEKINAVTIRR